MDGKLVKNQQQQWGFVKEETFSSDHHHHHQFEWPAKNYSCNFCRREFKSAQALGGHMNVHRRDRARLRLLPSWMPADNSYPNPNLSLSSAVPPFIINSVSFIEDQDHHHKKLSPNSSTPQDHDHDYEVLHVLKKKKTTSLGNFEGSNSNEDLDLELHL